VKEQIKQVLTGKDNKTHDVVRWGGFSTIFIALGLTIFVVVWRNQPFDAQAFGIGMGAVFTTLGVALKIKETTEPQQ
jgi:hypothetical protein